MRTLMANEIHHVAGGTILADLQSLGQNGFTHSEQTLSVFCLGAGMIAGGFLSSPIGPIVGGGLIAAWIGWDIYKSYKITPTGN